MLCLIIQVPFDKVFTCGHWNECGPYIIWLSKYCVILFGTCEELVLSSARPTSFPRNCLGQIVCRNGPPMHWLNRLDKHFVSSPVEANGLQGSTLLNYHLLNNFESGLVEDFFFSEPSPPIQTSGRYLQRLFWLNHCTVQVFSILINNDFLFAQFRASWMNSRSLYVHLYWSY